MHHPDEKNILAAVNLKKRKSWSIIYKYYYPSLCSFVLNIVKDEQASKDIVQELFIKIWEGSRTFDSIDELTNFIYKSCYNNALKHLRSSRNSMALENLSLNVQSDETFFIMALQEEVVRQLKNSIEKLTPSQKEIILMRIEGTSWNDIARQKGVSINTVKTLRARSFKTLREDMSKLSVEYWLLLLLFCM